MMVSQLKHKNGVTMILSANSGDRAGDRVTLSPDFMKHKNRETEGDRITLTFFK